MNAYNTPVPPLSQKDPSPAFASTPQNCGLFRNRRTSNTSEASLPTIFDYISPTPSKRDDGPQSPAYPPSSDFQDGSLASVERSNMVPFIHRNQRPRSPPPSHALREYHSHLSSLLASAQDAPPLLFSDNDHASQEHSYLSRWAIMEHLMASYANIPAREINPTRSRTTFQLIVRAQWHAIENGMTEDIEEFDRLLRGDRSEDEGAVGGNKGVAGGDEGDAGGDEGAAGGDEMDIGDDEAYEEVYGRYDRGSWGSARRLDHGWESETGMGGGSWSGSGGGGGSHESRRGRSTRGGETGDSSRYRIDLSEEGASSDSSLQLTVEEAQFLMSEAVPATAFYGGMDGGDATGWPAVEAGIDATVDDGRDGAGREERSMTLE